MRFEVKDTLTPEESEQALHVLIKQGLASQVKLTLTEGVFIVAFALLLGAPNSVIGILAATPSISQLLQVPAVYLVHRFKSRRAINFFTTLGSRITILFIALIPYYAEMGSGLWVLVILVALQAAFVAIGSPSWNSLMRDLVPQDRLGQFFSRRMALAAVVAITVSLAGGFFLGTDPTVRHYSLLFYIAFAAGLITVYYVGVLPEPKKIEEGTPPTFRDLLTEPYRNENFRNLMIFSGVWSFSASLVAPFFTVYLLVRLSQSLPFVTVLAAITQIMSILFFRFWGRLSDKYANKPILYITTAVFLIGTFIWTYSTIAKSVGMLMPLLVIIHVLAGISSAGVNLTSNNIGLKLAPRGGASSYLAAKGIVIAIAGAIAPIVGGLLVDYFGNTGFSLDFTLRESGNVYLTFSTVWFEGIDFLFLISIVIGVYSLHRLALVKEEGEVDERVVIDAIMAETRRNVKTFSTVDGLRHTFQAPLSTLKDTLRRERERKPGTAQRTIEAGGDQ